VLFYGVIKLSNYFIISLDFDGVLAYALTLKLKYAKEWFGVNLTLSQTKKEGFNKLMESLGKNDINYRKLMDKIVEEHSMEFEIPQNCIPVLKRLHNQGFRFVVITSRNDHDYPYAKSFIKTKFGNLIKYIHNTKDEPKEKFVKKLKPRIHLDDDLYKLQALINVPLHLVYYRLPDNQQINLKNDNQLFEVDNWLDFESLCLYLKQIHEAICWSYGLKNVYSNNKSIYKIYNLINSDQLQKLIKEYFADLAA